MSTNLGYTAKTSVRTDKGLLTNSGDAKKGLGGGQKEVREGDFTITARAEFEERGSQKRHESTLS